MFIKGVKGIHTEKIQGELGKPSLPNLKDTQSNEVTSKGIRSQLDRTSVVEFWNFEHQK